MSNRVLPSLHICKKEADPTRRCIGQLILLDKPLRIFSSPHIRNMPDLFSVLLETRSMLRFFLDVRLGSKEAENILQCTGLLLAALAEASSG